MKETRAKFENLENVAVSNRPTATAGPGKLLPFPTDRDQETLALPPDLVGLAKNGMVDIVTFTGVSLEGIGIYDGERGLCKTAFNRKEITPTTVCIVYLHETGETLAKAVVYKQGSVILKSFHPSIEDMIFRPDQVQVQGILLYLLRRPDENGRFDRAPASPKILPAERKRKLDELIQRFQKKPAKEELPF